MEPDAVSTPARPASRSALGLVFMIVFIDLLGFAIVLPLLPRYAERFHASNATIGLLFSSFSAMQFLFAPLWGRLSDRVGRRPALLAGLAGSVVCYALFGVATIRESLPLLFVSRIGAGIAGATIAAAQAYIADATDLKNRARGMAMIGAAFGVGFTFGPIIGSLSLPGQGERLDPLPGFIAAGLSLIAFTIALLKLPESLRPDSPHTRRTWLDLRTLRDGLRIPTVGLLLGFFFLSTFSFAQFESTLSRLTDAVYHLGYKQNFYLFSYIGFVLVIVQGGIVRRIAPRVGEVRLLIIGALLMGIGLAMIGMLVSRPSLAMLMIAIAVVVCGFAFITPCVQALISRRSDPARQGEVLGINQSAAAMARILGPFCGNVIFGLGPSRPYMVGAILLIPAFVMALFSAQSGHDWQPQGVFPIAETE